MAVYGVPYNVHHAALDCDILPSPDCTRGIGYTAHMYIELVRAVFGARARVRLLPVPAWGRIVYNASTQSFDADNASFIGSMLYIWADFTDPGA
jgi:hypothetical protein